MTLDTDRPDSSDTVVLVPASYAQQRMWFLHRLDPANPAYAVSEALRLTGPLDAAALESALRAIVDRHEVLRSSFEVVDGDVAQVVHDRPEHWFDSVPAADEETARDLLAAAMRRPFDLARGPVFRALLVRRTPTEHLLLLSAHHACIDGWSFGLFLDELRAGYRAARGGCAAPEPPPIQYGDFADWQRERMLAGDLDGQLAYWRDRLTGPLPELRLPTDRPPPAAPSFSGGRAEVPLSAELTAAVRRLSGEAGATPFMTVLAAFAAFLHRYTGQADLVIGSPVANRTHTQLQRLIGLFVNTLPLRVDVTGDPPFRVLLERAREVCTGAYANQEIPLEHIVDEVRPGRDAARTPLFGVLCAMQNPPPASVDLGGVHTESVELPRSSARFDLELHVWDDPVRYDAVLVYSTDLFDPATAARMGRHLAALLAAAVADPSRPISALPLLTDAELAERGGSEAAEDRAADLTAAFRARVAATPDAAAVAGPEPVSYRVLSERADAVGGALRGHGVGPGTPVGVLLPAGAERAAVLLGILAAGGCCVPLDPTDPAPWIRRVLRATGTGLVVAPPGAEVPEGTTTVDPGMLAAGGDLPGPAGRDREPAFLVLGATGPVRLSHAAVLRQVTWLQETFPLGAGDTVRQAAPASDLAAWELLWPFLHGAAVTAGDTSATVAFGSPAELDRLTGTRLLLCTGAPLSGRMADRLRARTGALWRLWGVPEAGGFAIAATYWPGAGDADWATGDPAGRPVDVVEASGQPAPPGVEGEIVVGGVRTGERGRLLPSGRVRVLGTPRRYLWAGTARLATADVESAVRTEPSVHECLVLPGTTLDGLPEMVAVVVPAAPVTDRRVLDAARRELPAAAVPAAVTQLSTLPRAPSGTLDPAPALATPVLDGELAERGEQALRPAAGVRQVAVAVEDAPASRGRLHLDDVVAAPAPAPAAAPEAAPEPTERRTAVSRTDPLPDPPTVATLGDALRRAAAARPPEEIVHVTEAGERRQTYAELLDAASRALAGLRRAGVRPGDRAVLQLEDNADFLVGLWACLLGGVVPVPLAVPPTYDDATRVRNALQLLGDPWLLANGRAVAALTAPGWPAARVLRLDDLRAAEPATDHQDADPDELALLLLTSGSTGLPKAVQLSHANVLARGAATAAVNGFTAADVSLNVMPLDHVGGVVMFHLRDVYLGCRQVHAPTPLLLADPVRWLEWVDRYRATTTWAPNFAYALVNGRAEDVARAGWDLSCLRFILNAGEAIVARVARRFLRLLVPLGLPATAMHPAWGMSETSSAVTYSDDFRLDSTADEDLFVMVGRPLPGTAIRIVGSAGEALAEGEIGRVQVSGPTVTAGYLDNAELNAEVFTADRWFETGDLGFLRDGAMAITGRVKDVIIVNGVNYYCHEIEAAVEDSGLVDTSFTAACAVRDGNATTDRVAVFLHLRDGVDEASALRDLRALVTRRVGVTPDHLVPVPREAIPKTEIGKIQRSRLRERFEAGDFAAEARRADTLLGGANTLPDWFLEPVWLPAQFVRGPGTPVPRDTLVVVDGRWPELGERLAAALRDRGERCELVRRPSDWGAELDRLAAGGLRPERIVHCAGYAPWRGGVPDRGELAESLATGVQDLVQLVRTAWRRRPDRTELVVVAAHSQPVDLGSTVHIGRAAAVGLTCSIPQELPLVSVRHVDVPYGDADVGRLLAEVDTADGETTVAYRGGARLAPRLRPPAMPAEPAPAAVRRGGCYLITGGLGGLGSELARQLLETYAARVILVGRTRHDDVLAGLSGIAEDRLRFAVADVTDPAALRAAVAAATHELDGAFHLAGAFEQRPLVDTTPDQLAAVLTAKVEGALAVHELLADRPGALSVSFSSVNGFFGGALVGGYAAACSALDGLAHVQRAAGLAAVSVGWSSWGGIGMSSGLPTEPGEARGYEVITPARGLPSLTAALGWDRPHLLVGVDRTKAWPRCRSDEPARPVRRLAAYVDLVPGADIPPAGPALVDRYGKSVGLEVVDATAALGDKAGRATRDEILSVGASGRSVASAPPRTDLERRLSAVWATTLGVDEVGTTDNFFALGGNSLLLAQAHGGVQQAAGRDVSIVELFQHPTIASLAAHLSEAGQPGSPARARARGAARRQAAEARRRDRPDA